MSYTLIQKHCAHSSVRAMGAVPYLYNVGVKVLLTQLLFDAGAQVASYVFDRDTCYDIFGEGIA